MICIYGIKHIDSGRLYIGSTINLKRRWVDHKKTLRSNRHYNRYLQNAWNRYREESFEFLVIEECSKDILLDREKFWFDKTNCCNRSYGFNIATEPNGGGGWKHTEETRIKLRGPRPSVTGKNNPMYGKKHSEETKRKIANSRSLAGNKKWTQESKNKLAKNNRHRKLSDEQIVEIYRLSHKGNKSMSAIGRLFDISHGMVIAIRDKKSWKFLTENLK